MNNEELNNLLLQLLDKINNTQVADEMGRKLLHDLDEDIHELIERSGETSIQAHPAGVQNLESALAHFEVTHPEITMLVSRLLDFLSKKANRS